MQPYTLSVASTHRCTHTTLCRYATKEEKATKTCKSLLDEAIRRAQEKGVDDEEGAVRIFSSYLVQQVGGRDWSAQEVSHVNMGLHTTWGSHEFNERNLTLLSRLRKNISREDDDTRRADLPSDFELYLNRWKWIFEGNDAVDPLQPLINGESHERAADILSCSFAEFYRKYEYGSAGAGKKGKRIIHKIERPTVCVIKPQMPRSWGKPGHPKRADYCRVQLQAYKTFNSKLDDTTADDNYDTYMTKHGGSFESAYEELPTHPKHPRAAETTSRPSNSRMRATRWETIGVRRTTALPSLKQERTTIQSRISCRLSLSTGGRAIPTGAIATSCSRTRHAGRRV